MNKGIKLVLLRILKAAGGLFLARLLTRRGLRILCYHGFSIQDEHLFRPGLFLTSSTFKARMDHLLRAGYPVFELGEALDRMATGSLPSGATVLTVDDGFYDFQAKAFEIVRGHRFPITVYLTTYYHLNRRPIFRLVVQYMFWKTRESIPDFQNAATFPSAGPVKTPRELQECMWAIIRHGESCRSEEERVAICRELARYLHVDYDAIDDGRLLHLLDVNEARDLSAAGVDLQLHTHRHRLPLDRQEAIREVEENRTALAAVSEKPARHFCYPSGIWQKTHWEALEAAGVVSAVTCDSGFNYRDTPRYGLRRFLDAENVTQLEFEAEMAGVLELFRLLRKLFPFRKSGGAAAAPKIVTD